MLPQIWMLTLKELKMWARRPGQWAVLFVVPLLFIWICNAVFGGSSGPSVAIYLVNEDGDKPEKRAFCNEHGLEYVVLQRLPKDGLIRRSSTDLRGY